MLWSNAGFGNVRKVPGLDDYEPRYDPTVIPTSNGSTCKAYESQFPDFSYGNSPNVQDRGTSIADYHDAYKAGETTPTKVAEAVLALAEERLENKTVFLSIKKDQIIAAAEASTRRYKEGKAKGLLDGVPLAIKGKMLDVCFVTLHCFLLIFAFWISIARGGGFQRLSSLDE